MDQLSVPGNPDFRTVAVEELEQIHAAIERALPLVSGVMEPRPGEDDPSGEEFMEYVEETTMSATELKIASETLSNLLKPIK